MSLVESTRADWGATPNTWDYPVQPSRRVRRVWHWAGGRVGLLKSESHSNCLHQVKAWETFHRSKGFGGIGYNFLICPHAMAIEGRGRDWVGAHCPGWNTEGYGIQFMVGGDELVSSEMFARGVKLAQDLELASGHDLWDNGHGEGVSTSCPGVQVQTWVNAGGPESVTSTPKPELIGGGVNYALLVEDGVLGRRSLKVFQKIQILRGHDECVVDGFISPTYSSFVASVQTDLNARKVRCLHGNSLKVDGVGIDENTEGRYPSRGTTHTLEAAQKAAKTYVDGYLSFRAGATPSKPASSLIQAWQRDANKRTSRTDSFLWAN